MAHSTSSAKIFTAAALALFSLCACNVTHHTPTPAALAFQGLQVTRRMVDKVSQLVLTNLNVSLFLLSVYHVCLHT